MSKKITKIFFKNCKNKFVKKIAKKILKNCQKITKKCLKNIVKTIFLYFTYCVLFRKLVTIGVSLLTWLQFLIIFSFSTSVLQACNPNCPAVFNPVPNNLLFAKITENPTPAVDCWAFDKSSIFVPQIRGAKFC